MADNFNRKGESMNKQSGITFVELIILVAIVGILLVVAVAGMGSCAVDPDKAQEAADEFKQNIPGATNAVCVATDSDGDGYCSCTVFRKEGMEPVALDCGCETMCLRCSEGCKMAMPKFKER
jgi:Tfp pilus assembly protein FimT